MITNAANDLIEMAVTCKELISDDMPDEIQAAANDALRSLIKSMAILGYNLVSGDDNDNYR
ncbi:MAG: hypothetical protein CMI54_00460 [Parcubacteria group bacterium]|jgi:hypothetical protein|nr:hypothetical protein [Parcubacteria group bacterium]|tara:strand:- start:1128 stop:1310 length:183 start_codon:yes stop_codon:yes gene_type:complete